MGTDRQEGGCEVTVQAAFLSLTYSTLQILYVRPELHITAKARVLVYKQLVVEINEKSGAVRY